MAKKERELKVTYSPRSLRDLDSVWDWNAERFGSDWATEFCGFLRECTDGLSVTRRTSNPIEGRKDMYQILLKSVGSRWAHGYIAVFHLGEDEVTILHYFHTAEDWPNKI